MEITVVETVSKKVEINLPMYIRTSKIHCYKVYSEQQAIQVCSSKYNMSSISEVSVPVAFSGSYELITQDEFEKEFCAVIELFKSIIVE